MQLLKYPLNAPGHHLTKAANLLGSSTAHGRLCVVALSAHQQPQAQERFSWLLLLCIELLASYIYSIIYTHTHAYIAFKLDLDNFRVSSRFREDHQQRLFMMCSILCSSRCTYVSLALRRTTISSIASCVRARGGTMEI